MRKTKPEEIAKLTKMLPMSKMPSKLPKAEPKVEDDPPRMAVDPALLRRSKPKVELEPEPKPPALTSGAIDKIVDLALNPSKETIRGFTNIDRIQGKLLPQLDIIDMVWQYVIEIAAYRQNAVEYEKVYSRRQPQTPNLIEAFTYRVAQWQKSVAGKSLQSAIDLALAETETKSGEEGEFSGRGGFED